MAYTISDHYDGTHFFNPEPAVRSSPNGKRPSFFTFLIRRMRRDPADWAQWPKWVVNKAWPAPVGEVAEGSAEITFIGHSSFLVRLPGLNFLTDPVFSKRCSPVSFAGPKRVRDPGIALDDLPKIDLVLVSHNHYDHLDVTSLRRLRKRFPEMRIVTTLGNAKFLAKKGLKGAVELDWWGSDAFGETQVTATPARHFAARTLWDRNETLWASFVLEHRGAKIFFGGDSGYTKFYQEIGQRVGAPDISLLPIGAYEPRWFMGPVHMNPADAVQAFQDLGGAQAIGCHFGTFQLTAEAIDQPEIDLAAAKTAASLADDSFVTLDCGETRRFEGIGAGSGNRTRASSLGS